MKMRWKICILMVCLVITKYSGAQALNDSAFQAARIQSIPLTDAGNLKNTPLKNIGLTTALVLFVFLSPECPLCKNYSPVLNTLQQQYGHTVKIIGIIPGKTYDTKTVNGFAKKYKISFPLFIDPLKKITNYLHASITPEVLLLDNHFNLVYKGAIDNRVKQLGANSGKATENYLSDAISQYLQHTTVMLKRVKAIGCLINDF